MNEAQTLHASGQFRAALEPWGAAEQIAPSPLERGMAIRGQAASLSRDGTHNSASEKARTALDIHDRLLDAITPNTPEMTVCSWRRECAQSAIVLGETILRRTAYGVMVDYIGREEARGNAAAALCSFFSANELLKAVENQYEDTIDQYSINLASRAAVALALSNTKGSGRAAFGAILLGFRSESPRVANTADLSGLERRKAQLRAIARGAGAVLISGLSTRPLRSTGYEPAWRIAGNRYFGV